MKLSTEQLAGSDRELCPPSSGCSTGTLLTQEAPVVARVQPAAEGTIRRTLRTLLAGLDAAGIPHAVLRGAGALDGSAPAGDVDLLVERRHLAAFERELEAACRACGASNYERHRAGFLRQYYLHGRNAAGRHELFAVDVHTAEACFGVPFLSAAELLRTAHWNASPFLAASAVIDFLSPYLSGGHVRASYARRLLAIEREYPEEVGGLLRRLLGRSRAARFLEHLRSGRGNQLASEARGARAALLARAFLRHPLRSLDGFVTFLYGTRVRPLWAPRGRFIAFLGTDGSGKSTLAEAVFEELAPAFRSDRSAIVHLRPGLLPQINTLLHLGRTTYTLADMSSPHRAEPSGRLGSSARVAYYWLDYWIGYFVLVLPRRRRHSLVVFDRYFHDYLVDPLRFRVRPGTRLASLLAAWIPRPEHVFICTAAPELVHGRKRELPLEESRRQVEAFEELARERGFTLIRTDESVENCVEKVLDSLFEPDA